VTDATNDLSRQASRVGALAEPARRQVYEYVIAQPDAVSRDRAAEGVGIPRHTAKFHLDRLVEVGLLEPEYRRLTGRQGPGAGRPAKLYRRADRQVTVNLPERRYELAAQILADAVTLSTQEDVAVRAAVERCAARAGRQMATATSTPKPLVAVLADNGYEPRQTPERVVLANCPFHRLVERDRELVCSMNLHLISAAAEALGDDADVRLDPGPGRCCVTMGLPGGRRAPEAQE
jgi:predicted ArsR family transcriptional regulator